MTNRTAWQTRNTHLKQLEEEYGTGVLSAPFRNLTSAGVKAKQAKDREERIALKGTTVPANPYVSDVDTCARKRYFSYKGVQETNPIPDAQQITFDIGHAFEDILANRWTAAGVEFAREVPAEIEHNGMRVSGRIDFILHLTPEQADEWGFTAMAKSYGVEMPEALLVEAKTKNMFAMKYQISKEIAGASNNRKQTNLYLHMSQQDRVSYELNGKVYTPKWTWGALLYGVVGATAGTPIEHGYLVPYSESMAVADLIDLTTTFGWAEDGYDPGIPIEFQIERKQKNKIPTLCASYCRFGDICWKGAQEVLVGGGMELGEVSPAPR